MRLLHMLARPARPTPPPRRRSAAGAEDCALAAAATHPTAEAIADADEAPPRGCGWYDSSHELQAGLRITEHTDVAAVVNQIPLSWWLGWELDAARASAR